MATTVFTDGVTLSAASWFNDVDGAGYPVLSSVAGTNTITATGPANYTLSATRPPVWFIPAVTNTGATTIAITPSGGAALTAKNVFAWGVACAGGELIAGNVYGLAYDGTQFNILNPSAPTLTNTLSQDVALNNTSNYFTGPSVAQGTVGKWFVSGSITVRDTAGAANFSFKLWDGTTVIASGREASLGTNNDIVISLSGHITSPAGNLRIDAKDESGTTGVITFNSSGNSKDSTITARRIG